MGKKIIPYYLYGIHYIPWDPISLYIYIYIIIYIYIYNPKSEKVGTVWKTQIKKESSDF